MKQYRTLGDGDVRMPGWQWRQRRGTDKEGCLWYDGDSRKTGDTITATDAAFFWHRAPCSATVPPDGYEVVDLARLPKDARVGAKWLQWAKPWTEDRWQVLCGGWAVVPAFCGAILAAPADELAALYAQGDAERAGIAIGEAFAADAEKLADSLRQQLAPQCDAEREQPATAPASPCPCCAERDRLADEVAEVRRAWDATVEARDQAIAEVERLRAEYSSTVHSYARRIAAAGAALEGRDG